MRLAMLRVFVLCLACVTVLPGLAFAQGPAELCTDPGTEPAARIEACLAAIAAAEGAAPETRAALHTAHGDALRAAGAHGSALEAYHAAIRAQRRFAPAYEGRAEAELALDQFRPAIRSLDVAIGFSPENVALYGRRALAFCWIGQVDAAMTDWARAREVDAAAGIEQLALLAALDFYKGDPGAGFARDALQAQRAYGDAGCP